MANFFSVYGLGDQLQWILALIAIDVVVGIVAAAKRKEFRLAKVAGFMKRGILPYVFGLSILAAAIPSDDFLAVRAAGFILIVLALAGSILNNVAKLGINIPAYLKKD